MRSLFSFLLFFSACFPLLGAEFDSKPCTVSEDMVCRQIGFKSVFDSTVQSVILRKNRVEHTNGTLTNQVAITVRYIDHKRYFGNAPKLKSYIGLHKGVTNVDGNQQNSMENQWTYLSKVREGQYQGQYVFALKGKKSESRETLNGLALAFTDDSGKKWDSDFHKNYFIWLAIPQ